MGMLWERDEAIGLNECIFADDYVAEEVRDHIGPATTDNLLLWGPPGTGKSTVVRAIAYARYGTAKLEDEGVVLLNCKDKEQAKQLRSKWLQNSYSIARCNADCPILVLDELDELSDAQQRELTAFIDWSNTGRLRSMVLATTNVDLRDRKSSATFSDALLSRFNAKLEMRPIAPDRLLPLAQSKLVKAGVHVDDEALLHTLRLHTDPTATAMDIRVVQTVVNKLIRRGATQSNEPSPKRRLRLV